MVNGELSMVNCQWVLMPLIHHYQLAIHHSPLESPFTIEGLLSTENCSMASLATNLKKAIRDPWKAVLVARERVLNGYVKLYNGLRGKPASPTRPSGVAAFEEVRRGKPVFDVFIEGAMEAAVSIPENMIGDVYIGLKGEVRLPNRADAVYQAVVSEVGSAATSANAFPVKATITDADEEVRPGMTAELTLLFALEEEGQSGYLVPVQALAPGLASDDRHVFVYDTETSTVRKTTVQGGGLVGNQVIITTGIGPGDVIVVAGVPFLRDGQQVTLLNPSHGG